jgi:uncharacterized protein YciI
MTGEGNLALSGQFPQTDSGDLRGVAIYRVAPEQAAKLTQEDPAVKAGIFKTGIHPWASGKGVLPSGQPLP